MGNDKHKEEKYGGRTWINYQSGSPETTAAFMEALAKFTYELGKVNIFVYSNVQVGVPDGGCIPGSPGCPG